MTDGPMFPLDPRKQAQVLLPVRMLNEYVYCPRLYYFMHVDGRWAENVYTAEGKEVHRRVDRLDQVLPNPVAPAAVEDESVDESIAMPEDEPPKLSRSVSLSSETLGVIAKLDLVSSCEDEAVPVETKRGKVPDNPERSYAPERVQLMAQGLLLREHGYRCDHGVLYFAGSRSRVDIEFDEELEALTLERIAEARALGGASRIPKPLEDSPKCWGCSLNAICMPDETLSAEIVPEDPEEPRVRRLYPMRTDARPLYVQEQGAKVGKRGQQILITKKGESLAKVRIKDVSQLVLLGNVQVSTQTVHLLCEASIPVVYLSTGHWFYGITHGQTLRNAYDREAQFRMARKKKRRLEFAIASIQAKGQNQRTILRRNASPRPGEDLKAMRDAINRLPDVSKASQVLGYEGQIASLYFSNFNKMLRPRDIEDSFEYRNRNRRPPKDPVNSLLSFSYALLCKECTSALLGEGLDPWWGMFHQPRHGRPALALDLMEEFRPILSDSAVLMAINTGMVTRSHFRMSKAGCLLKPEGKKAMIRAYETRMDQLMTHPRFGYKISWRTAVQLQARLLSRWFRGDLAVYEGITTR